MIEVLFAASGEVRVLRVLVPPNRIVSARTTGTELAEPMLARRALRGVVGTTMAKSIIHTATQDSPKISRWLFSWARPWYTPQYSAMAMP